MDIATRCAYATANVECPDVDTLASLFADRLSTDQRAAIANHAATCSSCHGVISALMVTAATATADDPPRPLAVGARIDRYVIEARLGAGGMGVVYAARDPALGRRVAVKVLRAGADGDRLRREAQALARLSHPNVVAVHDVGVHDGRVFVAMALIEGQNLRQWTRTPRPIDQIVAHLLAAGRGLAAAHRAGLIHRDLKPDNLLVSDDGQALVGDFGLARALGDPAALDAGGDDAGDPRLAPDLTVTGVVLGTPAYMAPEQAAGEATAASDQFSFCVTAWEALYRERPYPGQTVAALQAAIRAGRRAAPPADAGVPDAIAGALARGLAADPAARFPSMDALLTALTPIATPIALTPTAPPPRARRWRWRLAALGAIAGAGVAAAAIVATRGAPDAAASCAATVDGLASVWGSARRTALERSLTARAPDAAGDIGRVIAIVEDYARGWNQLRHQVCLADPGGRDPGTAGRIACLDRRALALDATLALIAAEATLAPRDAWRLADRLRATDRCARAVDTPAPPRSPALDRVRASLAEIGARGEVAARWDDLIAARARLETLDDPALLLDTLVLEGRDAMARAEPIVAEAAARRALTQADRLRDDLGRAEAGALLTEALVRLGRVTEAQGQLPQAIAAHERGGGHWETGLALARARAVVARATGDPAGEIAQREQELAELRRHHPDDGAEVLEAAIALADVYQRAGQPDRARAAFALIDRSVGDDLSARQAAAIRAMYALTESIRAGDFAAAIAHNRLIVALYRELGHPDYQRELAALAATYEIAGDWHAAVDGYRTAVQIHRDRGAAGALDLIDALEGLARTHLELRDAAAAIAPAREAHQQARRARDRERAQTTALVLGRALVATRQLDEVAGLIEPVVRALDADPEASTIRRASAAFTLAQALWVTGGERDRERARALVRDAVRDLTGAGGDLATDPSQATVRRMVAARLDAAIEWLARHP